jgi:hypothetical protein
MKPKYRIFSATIIALTAVLFLTSGMAFAVDKKCDPTKCAEVCKVPCNTATAQATQTNAQTAPAAGTHCCKGDSTCCKTADGKCCKGADGKCPMGADGKCTMTADGKCPKAADGKCSMATGNKTCAKAASGGCCGAKKTGTTPGKT